MATDNTEGYTGGRNALIYFRSSENDQGPNSADVERVCNYLSREFGLQKRKNYNVLEGAFSSIVVDKLTRDQARRIERDLGDCVLEVSFDNCDEGDLDLPEGGLIIEDVPQPGDSDYTPQGNTQG